MVTITQDTLGSCGIFIKYGDRSWKPESHVLLLKELLLDVGHICRKGPRKRQVIKVRHSDNSTLRSYSPNILG
jgi:hypothetical protein